MDYRILPPSELPEAEITLPLSKSMSNRALIINALSGLDADELEVADCDDTRLLAAALASSDDEIDIDGAGTAMRFLTAFFAICRGRTVTLTGNDRMRHRPIGPLVDALRRLGAQIEYTGEEGFPPLRITGTAMRGGEISIDASMSSQYVSALMMIAPCLTGGLKITLEGETGSMPYIHLTHSMMVAAGAKADVYRSTITVEESPYTRAITEVEADWSAASYWYELEAVSSGFLTLMGLHEDSRQGDAAVARIFADLGVNTEFNSDYNGQGAAAELMASPDFSPRLTIDLADNPDLTPAIAVTCALIGVPFRLTGLDTLRIKECDRFNAISRELAKLGVVVDEPAPGVMEWLGRRNPLQSLPEFDTYGDHRMAMAFAPVAIYIPGIKIRDVEVVSKSYPGFWSDLRAAGFNLVDGDATPEQLFEAQQETE